MKFNELRLSEKLELSIAQAGFKTATPIQELAIPKILAGGDLVASAQTGTGKTAAFAIPIIQKLSEKRYSKVRPIRALILTPTRELASQVGANFKTLGKAIDPKLRCIEIFGGVKVDSQEHKLRKGCDILIATPGRLLDLLERQIVKLNFVQVLVMDEGDRLLELGFQPDVRKICKYLQNDCQKLLFSATINNDLDELGAFILKRPEHISTITDSIVVEKIKQVVHCVPEQSKQLALRAVLDLKPDDQVLVFVNTRSLANKLTKSLAFADYAVGALHGEVDQKTRAKVLADFINGEIRILVATDVAARGLHIPDLPLVVNYELPNNADDYVHRTGRTGRTGKSGRAVTLATIGEMNGLEDIEELLGEKIRRVKIPGFNANDDRLRKRKDDVRGKRKGKTNDLETDEEYQERQNRSFRKERYERSVKGSRRGRSGQRSKDDRTISGRGKSKQKKNTNSKTRKRSGNKPGTKANTGFAKSKKRK